MTMTTRPTLPPHVQAFIQTNLTHREQIVLRLELDKYGIRRTAAYLELSETSVRFYRLSAWAKIGKHLVVQELHKVA
jgi:DNA-binding CsgD family transcriptional regulator